jgi:hypothetical protein
MPKSGGVFAILGLGLMLHYIAWFFGFWLFLLQFGTFWNLVGNSHLVLGNWAIASS